MKSKVVLDGPRWVKTGKSVKLRVVVLAEGVTPSGTVTIEVKAPGKRTKTLTAELNKYGKAKVTLGRFTKPGKVKVKVTYAGDAAVLAGSARTSFHVTPKRRGRR